MSLTKCFIKQFYCKTRNENSFGISKWWKLDIICIKNFDRSYRTHFVLVLLIKSIVILVHCILALYSWSLRWLEIMRKQLALLAEIALASGQRKTWTLQTDEFSSWDSHIFSSLLWYQDMKCGERGLWEDTQQARK